MANAGIAVDESIDGVGIGSTEAAERLLAVAGTDYRAVSVGPSQYQFARTVRPRWAVIVGCILLPVLVGLLFFLIRTSETWTASVEEDHRGVRVRVVGRVAAATLLALRDALGAGPSGYASTVASSGGEAPVVPAGPMPVVAPPVAPMPVAPTTASPPAPPTLASIAPPMVEPSVPPVAPLSVPAVPVVPAPAPAAPPGGVPAFSLQNRSPVVLPPAPLANPDAELAVPEPSLGPASLQFDTGERHLANGFFLVGRDPAASPGEEAVLIPIADPDRSVSKTHLSIRADEHAIWVADRGSTNGSWIVEAGDALRRLEPGDEVRLRAGQHVRFGKRSLTVDGPVP